jgi:hypothetical protein
LIRTQLIHELVGNESRPIENWDPNFLPVMMQTLFSANTSVQKISAKFAVGILGTVAFQKCQELLQPIISRQDIVATTVSEKCLLALVASANSNAVPPHWQKPLFEFLQKVSLDDSEVATVAIAALLQGFVVWTQFAENGEQGLYSIIIRGLLRRPNVEFIDELFCQIACAEFPHFMAVFLPLIEELGGNKDELPVIGLLNLYTRVAVKNQKVCGGFISLACAKLWEKTSILTMIPQVLPPLMLSHAQLFDSVDMREDVCLIGTPEGKIHGYRAGKCIFEEQIFQGSIVLVSLGPQMKFGVALSADLNQAAQFAVLEKATGLFRKRLGEVTKTPLKDRGVHQAYRVMWHDVKNFSVEVVS